MRPSYTIADDVTLRHAVVGPLGMSEGTGSPSKGDVWETKSMVLITTFKRLPEGADECKKQRWGNVKKQVTADQEY